MSTFPVCLRNKTVIMPFDHNNLPPLNAQWENRCLKHRLLLLNWLFPSLISSPFRISSLFFLMNGIKRMTKKKKKKSTKGHFVVPNSRPTSLHWSFADPPHTALFSSKTSFVQLLTQCLVSAIWCLSESHPLPLRMQQDTPRWPCSPEEGR